MIEKRSPQSESEDQETPIGPGDLEIEFEADFPELGGEA
jgi:hypothetical protein